MDTTNRNTALATAFVDELARSGVRAATVSPGSRSTPLALAAWRHPAIAVQVVIDERAAGFHALGHALGTGVPAISIVTSGSAAANLHPAVVEADEAGIPLIVVTADRPPELRDIGAGQTIDQLHLFGGAPRLFFDVGEQEADDDGLLFLRSLACRAFAEASGEPEPGPVHVNFPFREPLAPVTDPGAPVTAESELALEGRRGRPLVAIGDPVRVLDEASTDLLRDRLSEAQRPLLVAGRNPHFHGGPEVAEFAAAWGLPVLADALSQLRWGPHHSAHVISGYDLILRGEQTALAPDLVLRIGDMPTSKPLRRLLSEPGGPNQVVVSPGGGWNEPTRSAELILRCGEVELLSALRPEVPSLAEEGWLERWQAAERVVESVRRGLAEGHLSEPAIWPSLSSSLRQGDIVVAASSMPVRDMESFMPPGEPDVRFLSNRGANGIDGQVATAAGVARSVGSRTILVLGDLALAHDVGSLELLEGAPTLQLIVIDNAGGGIFEMLPQATSMGAEEFEAILATPGTLRPEAAARAFGLSHATAQTPTELRERIEDGTRMIVVRTERKENLDLHRRLATEVVGSLGDLVASGD